MCGILYVHHLSSQPSNIASKDNFRFALSKMQYRGPDSSGIEIIDRHYFGHVRLSIIDLDATSNQPYQDNDHLMIYNGEIYNYKAIDPLSHSDTITLFHSLKEEKEPFTKLRGMFAIGWFDKHTKKMTFLRDFFGEKPLYYFVNEEIEVVSSTLKSLRYIVEAAGYVLELNKEALLSDYMWFGFIREPQTIWKNVFVVPPGHAMSFENGKAVFAALNFSIANGTWPGKKISYIYDALSSKDVEGTLLLSGGLDSTFVLAAAAKKHTSLRVGIYKANNPTIDESDKALNNILKMGISKGEFPVSLLSQSNGEDIDIEGYARLLEQPTSDGLQVYQLLKYLRFKHPELKLVYTGLGGDELFGGYPTFYNFYKINLMVHIPLIEKLLPSMKRFKMGKRILKQWNASVYAFLYRFNFELFELLVAKEEWIKAAFKSYLRSVDSVPENVAQSRANDADFIIKKAETFDYARNQLLRDNDNISMYLGFESRSPLLNPDWYFVKPDRKAWLKHSLRKNFGIHFGRKRGFTLDDSHIRQYLLHALENNKQIIESIIPHAFQSLTKLRTSRLRSLVVLLLWIKQNQ